MWRRVLGPWSDAALPEIMAGLCRKASAEEGKLDVPVPFSEGRAAGLQPGSIAGARGGGTAEARARPNVEVNRRAEGTSELNRRLGAGGCHRQHSFGVRAGNCQQRAGRATRLFATLLPSL